MALGVGDAPSIFLLVICNCFQPFTILLIVVLVTENVCISCMQNYFRDIYSKYYNNKKIINTIFFYKYALIINQVSCGLVIFKICYVLSQFNSIRIKDYSSHSPPTIQSRGRVALDIPNYSNIKNQVLSYQNNLFKTTGQR